MDNLINLNEKKGLIVGIANEHSIAYHCALQCAKLGAELAVSYRNDKDEQAVRALASGLACAIIAPLDVRDDQQMAALFAQIRATWGRLDFLLHAVAFAPRADLQCRYTDSSRDGFLTAMDISCHSLVRLARHAEPLMQDHGGCILTLSYYGAEKYVEQYSVMGPVKAALEGSVRYLAGELGHKRIRVHALSPGPIKTRAASGIARFDELMDQVAERTPSHQLADIDDVAAVAALLVSDRALSMNGNIIYIDAGYHVVA